MQIFLIKKQIFFYVILVYHIVLRLKYSVSEHICRIWSISS